MRSVRGWAILTCDQCRSEHEALAVLDAVSPGLHVLVQDGHGGVPGARVGSASVVVRPAAGQQALVVLDVDLRRVGARDANAALAHRAAP